MNLMMKSNGRLPLNALALALGIWVFSGPAAVADGDGFAGTGQVPKDGKRGLGRHGHRATSYGTLGYGGPGLYPGFQGFGLGYHPGYGYGGDALGVVRRRWQSLLRRPRLSPPLAAPPTDRGDYTFSLLRRPRLSLPRPSQLLRRRRPACRRSTGRDDRQRSWRPRLCQRLRPLYRDSSLSRHVLRPVRGRGRGWRVIQRGEFALSLHDPHEHRAGHGRDPRFARSRPLPEVRPGIGPPDGRCYGTITRSTDRE